jgi:hypothetical protein
LVLLSASSCQAATARSCYRQKPFKLNSAPAYIHARVLAGEISAHAAADHERDTPRVNRKVGRHGGDRTASDPGSLAPLKGTDRRATQLATRRPDLAEAVRKQLNSNPSPRRRRQGP